MHTAAAVLACVLLAALAVLQLCLALGAPWGRFVWGGRHDGRLPTGLRVGSAVSIALYALFATVMTPTVLVLLICAVVVALGPR